MNYVHVGPIDSKQALVPGNGSVLNIQSLYNTYFKKI